MKNNIGQVTAIISLESKEGLSGYRVQLLEEGNKELSENQKVVNVSSELWKQITTGTKNNAMKIIEELYNKKD